MRRGALPPDDRTPIMRTSLPLVSFASPLLVAILSCSIGCSSSSDGPASTSDTGTTSDTATATDTATASDTATATDEGIDSTPTDSALGSDAREGGTVVKPATPTIVSVMKMGGNLHVTWKLNSTGVSSVYLFRKKDAGTYEKAYTLPGTATSQHDTGASAPGTFCYQVQTVKAGVESDLSNEMCGTP
jgi:hypothetical protein